MTTDGPVFLGNQIGNKLYGIFIDPKPLYGTYHETKGLFAQFPYLFVGLCGMVVTSLKKKELAVLSVSVLFYVFLYSSYYDLSPQNIWHYNVVHYFVWIFPIFGLYGIFMANLLIVKRSTTVAVLIALSGVFLLTVRPSLFPLQTVETHLGDRQATLNLSSCAAPCIIDIENSVDEEKLWKDEDNAWKVISFDQDTISNIGARTASIFPYKQGFRILLLDPTKLNISQLSFVDKTPLKIHVSSIRWKFSI